MKKLFLVFLLLIASAAASAQSDCAINPGACQTAPVPSDCAPGKHWTTLGSGIAHCVANDPPCAGVVTHDSLGNPTGCTPVVTGSSTESQTLACQANYSGSEIQQRTVEQWSDGTTTYGSWATTSNSCTYNPPTCANGATDYPTCTPPAQSQPDATPACANGATNYPTCTLAAQDEPAPTPTCANGATNYPTCTLASQAQPNPFAGTNGNLSMYAENESNAVGPGEIFTLNSNGAWNFSVVGDHTNIDYPSGQSGSWLAAGFNASNFEIYWTGAVTGSGYDDAGNYITTSDVQSSSSPDSWASLSGGWNASYAGTSDSGVKTLTITIRKKSDPSISKTFTVTFNSFHNAPSGA